jgi:hypothetical protein
VSPRVLCLAAALVAATTATGCDDSVPPWELDNDRIIAVRISPPHIPAGAEGTIDAFVTRMGAGPGDALPSAAIAVSPQPGVPVPAAIMSAVVNDNGTWKIVAPDEPTLVGVRAELGLMPDAPIVMQVGITVDFATGPLAAIKTLTIGDTGDNPALGDVTVGGAPAADGMTVARDTDVPLHIPALEDDVVRWLTSVGQLDDEDDPDAMLNHDTEADPPSLTSGHLAVVKRDATGGVTWAYWTISVAP